MATNQDKTPKKKKSLALQLFLLGLGSLVVAIISFWLITAYFFPWFAKSVDPYAKIINWGLLEGFAGLATFALALGGVIFAIVEYYRNEKAEQQESTRISYETYTSIFDRLMTPEQEAARRWVYKNIPVLEEEDDKEEWLQKVGAKVYAKPAGWTGDTAPGELYLRSILNVFDYIGFVAEHHWEVDNDSLGWLSPPLTKVWERIKPYILYERKKRREDDYYASAEYICEKCAEWREAKEHPKPIVEL